MGFGLKNHFSFGVLSQCFCGYSIGKQLQYFYIDRYWQFINSKYVLIEYRKDNKYSIDGFTLGLWFCHRLNVIGSYLFGADT